MYRNECLKLYAEQHNINYEEACKLYDNKEIGGYELFEAYLHEEGIFGYTTAIITTFRECFK